MEKEGNATSVPLRRRKASLICPGLPVVSFELFISFVAEVCNKKVEPYTCTCTPCALLLAGLQRYMIDQIQLLLNLLTRMSRTFMSCRESVTMCTEIWRWVRA